MSTARKQEKKMSGTAKMISGMRTEWAQIAWPEKEEVKIMTIFVTAAAAATALAAAAIDAGMMAVISRLIGG